MRFRKRVSLGKGMNINLSKSGVSFTGGVKGLSMSVGKSGTFLNTSIPGTGLYDRKKIGGGGRKSTSRSTAHSYRAASAEASPKEHGNGMRIDVNLIYNEDGTITLMDPSGHTITNPELIKEIKASKEYKSELARLTEARLHEYTEKMNEIINIQKLTPKVYSTEEWRQRILSMRPKEYARRSFMEAQPSMDDVVRELTEEAEQTIDTWNKIKKKKLVQRYVDDTKDIEYNDRYRKWKLRKASFLEEEERNQRDFDAREEKRIKTVQQQYMQLVQGNELVIDKAVDGWLSTVEFPFDFELEYEHMGSTLFLDLDLPEIEELPEKKVQKMANGTAKVKPKAKKEIKEDYSKCVYGLAVFFAGNVFNRALSTQNIVLSGYTQRRNKNGDIKDDYIYSIIFDRETFRTLDYHADAKDNCMLFTNRVLQNADMTFKTIEPYSSEDVREVN